jgi:hypothetical protein
VNPQESVGELRPEEIRQIVRRAARETLAEHERRMAAEARIYHEGWWRSAAQIRRQQWIAWLRTAGYLRDVACLLLAGLSAIGLVLLVLRGLLP